MKKTSILAEAVAREEAKKLARYEAIKQVTDALDSIEKCIGSTLTAEQAQELKSGAYNFIRNLIAEREKFRTFLHELGSKE